MSKASAKDRQAQVTASLIMSAAGFDPQSGCGPAFRYVAGEVAGLDGGSDLTQAAARIGEHLSEGYRIQLGRPAEAGKIEAVLRSEPG